MKRYEYMVNYIIIAILMLVIGGAAFYVYRSKKHGDACIGCPYAKNCGGKCSCDSDKNK